MFKYSTHMLDRKPHSMPLNTLLSSLDMKLCSRNFAGSLKLLVLKTRHKILNPKYWTQNVVAKILGKWVFGIEPSDLNFTFNSGWRIALKIHEVWTFASVNGCMLPALCLIALIFCMHTVLFLLSVFLRPPFSLVHRSSRNIIYSLRNDKSCAFSLFLFLNEFSYSEKDEIHCFPGCSVRSSKFRRGNFRIA